MAVHFQRVEIVIAGALGFSLVTAENLRLGFGIQSAQLVAHPLDGRFHLAKGEADVADLLLDSTAEDRCFARQVDQTLQQFCGNLDQLLRCPPRSGFLSGQLCASNEWQHLRRAGTRLRQGTGRDDRLFQSHRLARQLWLELRRLRLRSVASVARQARPKQLDILQQRVVAVLHIEKQAIRPRGALLLRLAQPLLQIVGHVAQCGLPSQPRTAFQRVQHTEHVSQRSGILAAGIPATER